MKEKLMKKLENYQRLDAACDLALVVLVICGITACGGLEQGMMTIPTSLMLLAGVVIAAAIVLLVKRIPGLRKPLWPIGLPAVNAGRSPETWMV